MLRGTCWTSPQGPLQTKQRWVSHADGSLAAKLQAAGSNLLVVSLGTYLGAAIQLYYIITTPQVVKAVKSLLKAVAKKKTKPNQQPQKGKTALKSHRIRGGQPPHHAVMPAAPMQKEVGQPSGWPCLSVTPPRPSGRQHPS